MSRRMRSVWSVRKGRSGYRRAPGRHGLQIGLSCRQNKSSGEPDRDARVGMGGIGVTAFIFDVFSGSPST
jgi:hypothetical protein